MKTPVFKVAKRNFDARYAEPINLTIDSTKNQLKRHIIERGTVTFEGYYNSSMGRLGIPVRHELGYVPFFQSYVKLSSSSVWQSAPATLDIKEKDTGDIYPLFTGRTNDIYESLLTFYVIYLYGPGFEKTDLDYCNIVYIDPSKDAWS